MRDYGRIHNQFWTSDTIRALSDDGRMLAAYCLTSPHANMIGCFRLADGYVCDDLGWTVQRVTKGFAELFDNGFATRDDKTKWCVVKKYLLWNRLENPNQLKAAVKLYASIPANSGVKGVLAECIIENEPRFPIEILNGYETLPEPFRNQEQEQEQEQFKNVVMANGGAHSPASAHTPASASHETLDAAAVAVALIDWERERHKQARGISPSNPQVIDLAALGVTLAQLREAYDEAVADRDACSDPTPVNAGFVRTFIEKHRRPQRPKLDDWQRSDAGISRKAKELGVSARPGETYASLKDRVVAAQQRDHRKGAHA